MAQEIDLHLRAVRRTLGKPAEGLTGPQRSVMHAVVRSGGLSLKQLSRELGLAHSTVSGIVDRLEKRGLVDRLPDKRDGRVILIVAGKSALLVHCPLLEALRRVRPAERRAILEGLRVLRRVMA